ncbi:uridine kinase family protein [Acididesulfobacillus acetoxydans]|nr:nucleoside kinase [Acididesulfobacillus acetoxydans]
MSENTLRQYRQTAILGLILTVEKLFPTEQLKIAHSILNGIYCELERSLLSSREVRNIEDKLREWARRDTPITCTPGDDGFFHCELNGRQIKSLYPSRSHSGSLRDFRLVHYPPGFILLFPDPEDSEQSSPFVLPEKLSATFSESQRWVENLNLDEVSDINRIIADQRSYEITALAEALHEKKISLIADRILEQKRHTRIVLISGPSSSGKTTFAQRLSTQLRVNGLKPVPLSLDNYFLAREDTPRDASGQPDFEALEALDLGLLNRQLDILSRGGEAEVPIFDFVQGRRRPVGETLVLKPDEILVIEGIHGLNPRLAPSLGRSQTFKIYVSALFQLNVDPLNRIPTTEVRLIRRLVRDDQFRGIDPIRTLSQWPSVRRGENNAIFPYQEEADVMFNSSLLYELNALRPYAEPLLVNIPPGNPHCETAERLLRLLSFFTPLVPDKVPPSSILREFIGGSIYPV